MNHKLAIRLLEDEKKYKTEEAKQIQKKISEIDTALKEQKRLYLLDNKNADECVVILQGHGKAKTKKMLKFILGAVTMHEYGDYTKHYKGIDMEVLLKIDTFFDFLIVQIGKATIEAMFKNYGEVAVVDGEERISANSFRLAKGGQALSNRLAKKMTKKSTIDEAKRVTEEINQERRSA